MTLQFKKKRGRYFQSYKYKTENSSLLIQHFFRFSLEPKWPQYAVDIKVLINLKKIYLTNVCTYRFKAKVDSKIYYSSHIQECHKRYAS
jgi:hypothetical protein